MERINGIISIFINHNSLSIVLNFYRIKRTKHVFDFSHTCFTINLILKIKSFIRSDKIRFELIKIGDRIIISLRRANRNIRELKRNIGNLIASISTNRCIVERYDILIKCVLGHNIKNNIMNRIRTMSSSINRTNILFNPNTLIVLLVCDYVCKCSIIELSININTRIHMQNTIIECKQKIINDIYLMHISIISKKRNTKID